MFDLREPESALKQITLCLDKTNGILIGPSENKTAQAYLTGTIDGKNHLLLSTKNRCSFPTSVTTKQPPVNHKL